MPSVTGWAGAACAALASLFVLVGPADAEIVMGSKSDPGINLETRWNEYGSTQTETTPRLRGPVSRAARTAPPARPLVAEIRYDYAWIDTLDAPEGGDDLECMTEALYFEARGEDAEGVFAVAEVILNRVSFWRFPDDVCGVVQQGTGRKYECQFSYRCDGIADRVNEPRAWERMKKIAGLMLSGGARGLTDGAVYYHTKAVNPYWADVFDRVTTIGYHHFYVEKSA